MPVTDYGISHAIDTTLRGFTLGELEAVVRSASPAKCARAMSIAKETVRQVRSDWPRILEDAPDGVRRAVTERLSGGVALMRT